MGRVANSDRVSRESFTDKVPFETNKQKAKGSSHAHI